jgi:NTE family protein
MKFFLLLVCCGLLLSGFSQTNNSRPKIGVTLSGGGAKGLAHIGILKAIDSAGLQVDYLTGTSMGAVIGSLYSIGYSADTLEKIARTVDWDLLLSNQSGLHSLFMEEKDEYAKYDIELPWVNNRFQISTGFLEAEELWLKLSELFFPVTDIKDFSAFSIPFRAIATDVGNGEAVVLKDGEIISAIRSSMAIPSVFTAVDHNGKILVDGGISRNFPVRDVKEMGADIVIGSTVANGLLPPEKVKNVIQLLLQIAFFREAEDVKNEVPLCDIYIPFNLDKYSMGSFNDARAILKAGIDEGRRLYPRFKHLADSLDAVYGVRPKVKNRLPPLKKVCIDEYEINGLHNTSRAFFINTMNFKLNKDYTAEDIAAMVRRAFGTRYYSKIVYAIKPKPGGYYSVVFNVTENPLTFLKAGIHYNRFSGIGVIANITSRNLLFSNSRSTAAINIGETFRLKGEHLQYLGRLKNFGLTAKAQFDRFDVTTYQKTKQSGLYKQNLAEISEKLHFSPTRNFTMGIGHRFEWIQYKPQLLSAFEFEGRNSFSTASFYLEHNTLDRNIFPRRGIKAEWELARVFRQDSKVRFLFNGSPPPDPDSLTVAENEYMRTSLSAEGYVSFSPKLTAFIALQGGINFNYRSNVMNEFIVGGMTRLFRNQVTFAGLEEGTIYSPAVAAVQGGLRLPLFNGAYLTGRANVLFNNFISRSKFFSYEDFYSGYALTFSYNFALGPLELSVMYCDQTRKVQSYINLGIPF